MFDDSLLIHAAAEYDPIAAREYYLRTRELKGRTIGTTTTPSAKPVAKAVTVKGKVPVKAQATFSQKKASASARVVALTLKLDQVKKSLEELVKAAKARSGVITPEKTSTEKAIAEARSKAKAKGDTPQTAKQKADAAKRSAEAYEKNKKDQATSLDKQAVQLEKQIQEVQKKIASAQKDISEAIAKARVKVAKQSSSKKAAGFKSR